MSETSAPMINRRSRWWLILSALAWGCAPADGPGDPKPSGELVAHGYTLSAERDTDAPVIWPAGGRPALAQTRNGTLLAMDDFGQGMIRPLGADGQLGSISWLGAVSAELWLIPSDAGIVVLYTSGQQPISTRLLDPATGAPRADPVILEFPQGTGVTAATGSPGRLLWASVGRESDGGNSTQLRRLNDEGHDLGPGVDITSRGELVGLVTGLGSHWAMFSSRSTDGGSRYRVDRVDDDGNPTPLTALPEPIGQLSTPSVFAATDTELFAAWRELGGVRFFFISAGGQISAAGTLPLGCSSITAASNKDDIWLACAQRTPFVSELLMVSLSGDGGSSSARVFPGDGGNLIAGPIATGAAPILLFERNYQELGTGLYRSTHLLPLGPSGTTAVGPPVAAHQKGSSQLGVGFASIGPRGPHALVWDDDRKLPLRPRLYGMTVSSSGEPLTAPGWLGTLASSNFVGSASLQRTVASNGLDFLVADSDTFDVEVAWWPADGGPVSPPLQLTPSPGLQSQPAVCGHDGGFLVTWNDRPLSGRAQQRAQRLDRTGFTLSTPVDVGDFSSADLVCDSERALIAGVGGDGVRLVSWAGAEVYDAGLVGSSDAGALRAWMARSGEVVLIAWEEVRVLDAPDRHDIFATRVWLDGGARLDATPRKLSVASLGFRVALRDVGVHGAFFYLVGAEETDAGAALWLWRVPVLGAIEEPRVVFPDILRVGDVAVGPGLADGGLLLAYARVHSELGPSTSRIHYRTLGGTFDPEASDAGHPPRLVAVGCRSTASRPDSWFWGWILLVAITRRRRTFGRRATGTDR